MTEKASPYVADSSHDEKNAAQGPTPELANTDGRRKSVALNIVENPLTVSSQSLPLLHSRGYIEH